MTIIENQKAKPLAKKEDGIYLKKKLCSILMIYR